MNRPSINRRHIISAAVALLILGTAAVASAAGESTINPGVRIGEWIYSNVVALFAPILAVVSLYYLAKRQFTQFLSFAAFAVLVSLFVFGSTEFKDAAVGLTKWIIGK
jgi:cell division protein FtsW (lipid II flippase)